MERFDGLRPARLKVGIISAGRVGTALGVALQRADHVVVACSAISHASRRRAQRRLPDTRCCHRWTSRPALSCCYWRSPTANSPAWYPAWQPPRRCGHKRLWRTPPELTGLAFWRR